MHAVLIRLIYVFLKQQCLLYYYINGLDKRVYRMYNVLIVIIT